MVLKKRCMKQGCGNDPPSEAISMVKENENLTSRFGKMSRTQIVSHLTNDNTHLACVTIILELLDDSYRMKRLNNRLEKELKEVTKDRNYYYKEVKHNMPQVRYDKSIQRQLKGLKERVTQDRKDLEALRKCKKNLEEKLRKRRNLTTKKPRKTRHEWRAYFRQLKNDTLYKLGNKWGMRSLMSYNTRTMTGPPRATLKADRIELLIEHLEVMGRVLDD